jgi:hypothetical protein
MIQDRRQVPKYGSINRGAPEQQPRIDFSNFGFEIIRAFRAESARYR